MVVGILAVPAFYPPHADHMYGVLPTQLPYGIGNILILAFVYVNAK